MTGPAGSSAAIAIAVALRAEERAIRGFVAGCGGEALPPGVRRGTLGGASTLLIRTGMGKENARVAVRRLLALEAPASIACLGFGGALKKGLEPGRMVVAREVLDASDGTLYRIPPGLLAAASAASGGQATTGRIVTVERVLRSAAEKEESGREFAAEAADMESTAVIAAAAERGLPVLCARAIIDECELDLRLDFAKLLAPDGSPRPLAILKAVAAHPALALDLAALSRRARLAARALGGFATRLARALGGQVS